MKELLFRIFTSIFLLSCLLYSYINDNFFLILLIIIIFLSLIEYSKLIFKIKKLKKIKSIYLIFGIFYSISAIYIIIANLDTLKNVIFYFIIICISTDIGGLIFGIYRIFKDKELSSFSLFSFNSGSSSYFG